MRFLLGGVAVLAIGWTGWWVFASNRIETALTEVETGPGSAIHFTGAHVGGYPYRFALELTDLDLDLPVQDAVWSLPRLDVTALAYQPQHLIAVFPEAQSLQLGQQTVAIAAPDMRASLRTRLTPTLPLARATLEAGTLGLRSDAGWGLDLRDLLLATRISEVAEAPPHAHHLVLTIGGIRPDAALRSRIDPAARLAEEIGPVSINAMAVLDGPVDRQALERSARLPELLSLDLHQASLGWGESRLELSGVLDFDAAGRANGTLNVNLAGWQAFLDLAISSGLVPDGQRRLVEQAMRMMEATRFGSQSLRLTLPVQDGVARLGPIPLGRLPNALRVGN